MCKNRGCQEHLYSFPTCVTRAVCAHKSASDTLATTTSLQSSVFINTQVCEQLLINGRASNDGQAFFFYMPKPKNPSCAITGNLRLKLLDMGRKFSRGDVYLKEGGLQPLTLPAAYLPSGHSGFWVSAGNTVCSQPPLCLSRQATSNR